LFVDEFEEIEKNKERVGRERERE